MMVLLHVIQKPDNDDDDSQLKKNFEHVLLLGNPLHAWNFSCFFFAFC